MQTIFKVLRLAYWLIALVMVVYNSWHHHTFWILIFATILILQSVCIIGEIAEDNNEL